MLILVLILAALGCLLAAAFGVTGRVNLLAFGLALLVLAYLLVTFFGVSTQV